MFAQSWMLLFAVMLAFFLSINILTPAMGEDYLLITFPPNSSQKSMAETIFAIIARILHQMTNWNIRVGEQISIVVSAFDPIVFDVCNSLVSVYYLWLVFLYAYPDGADKTAKLWSIAASSAVVVVLQPALGEVFFWRSGSTNCLWAICILLTFSYPVWCLCYGNHRDVLQSKPMRTGLLIICGFLAGMTNENTIPVFLALYLYAIVSRKRRGDKNPFWLYTSFLTLASGYLFLLKAPSTAIRVAWYRTAYGLQETSPLDHLAKTPYVIYRFFHDNTGLIILSSVCILSAILIEHKKRGATNTKQERMRMEPFALLLLGSLSCGALIMSPYIETRAFLLPDFLMTVCIVYYSERCLSTIERKSLWMLVTAVLGASVSICYVHVYKTYSDYNAFCAQRDAEIATSEGEYQWGEYAGPYYSRILTTREDYNADKQDNLSYYYSKDIKVIPGLVLNGDLRTKGYSAIEAIGSIDYAEYNGVERTITVYGWGTIPETNSAKNEVYFFLDDGARRIYYKPACNLERSDVVDALGDSRQLYTGFSISTTLPNDFSMAANTKAGFCVVNREANLVGEVTSRTVEMAFDKVA